MANYQLSVKADDDLTELYLYSHRELGEAQADAYLFALEERFFLLADNPRLGRQIDSVRPGYFRWDHKSHSIFYKAADYGIIVMRILHGMQSVESHLEA